MSRHKPSSQVTSRKRTAHHGSPPFLVRTLCGGLPRHSYVQVHQSLPASCLARHSYVHVHHRLHRSAAHHQEEPHPPRSLKPKLRALNVVYEYVATLVKVRLCKPIRWRSAASDSPRRLSASGLHLAAMLVQGPLGVAVGLLATLEDQIQGSLIGNAAA
jgi:hypothetical protein